MQSDPDLPTLRQHVDGLVVVGGEVDAVGGRWGGKLVDLLTQRRDLLARVVECLQEPLVVARHGRLDRLGLDDLQHLHGPHSFYWLTLRDGLFEGPDGDLEVIRPLVRGGIQDAPVQEVAHDAVSRRPVVPVAGDVERANVLVAERGLRAEDAKSHYRPPCLRISLAIAVSPLRADLPVEMAFASWPVAPLKVGFRPSLR